jgi:magnesium chelatase family protein
VPVENLAEAALSGARVCGAATLADLIGHFRGEQLLVPAPEPGESAAQPVPDLADVLGQPEARRALELAAAGGHHLVMIGPPGAGKTMLAKRLPGILPPLDDREAMAVTAIHSVAGMLDVTSPLIRRPPFIDPHHSASLPAMVGGGSGLIRPGAASLAHHGVLFLDEAPEFKPTVLDSLRQSLEDREVRVSRSNRTVTFPARFQLVVAANPCPCAAARDIDCSCAAGVRRKYLGRLSGPLLDRVDIRVPVAPLSVEALISRGVRGEPSAVVAGRVVRARARAARSSTGRYQVRSCGRTGTRCRWIGRPWTTRCGWAG